MKDYNIKIEVDKEEFKKKLNIKDGKDGEIGAIGPKGDSGKDGKRGPKGEKGDGKKGVKGAKGDQGEVGQDGSPDTPIEIVEKINTLPLTSPHKIDASHIKNLPLGRGSSNRKNYTVELGQDNVGSILTDTASIDFTYDDDAPSITADVLPAGVDHNSLANLATGDVHTQYALLAGRATGQTLIGGTAASEDLTLRATSHATDGDIIFQSDPTTERARILSTGEFLVGYNTLALGEAWGYQKNQNALSYLAVTNTTSGTAGRVAFIASNSSTLAASIIVQSLSAAYTTSGMFVADVGLINSSKVAGMNIGTQISAQLSFWTNNTERARFLSTGGFLVGGTALIGSESISVQKNQNAQTSLIVSNSTSGTAAATFIAITNSATGSPGLYLYSLSAGFTTNNIFVANTSVVVSDKTAGLNVGTSSNTQFSLWSNNAKRMTIESTGKINIGHNTAKSGTNLDVLGILNVRAALGATFLSWVDTGTNAYRALMNLAGTTADYVFYTAQGADGAETFQERFRVLNAGGQFGIGTGSPTAMLHIKAGTASASTAPLKFTSGTNLTTAEAGAMEYNGTNLFFTRTGTVREGVLTQSAVTTEAVVSDTTVTVNIGGTTYKLLARA